MPPLPGTCHPAAHEAMAAAATARRASRSRARLMFDIEDLMSDLGFIGTGALAAMRASEHAGGGAGAGQSPVERPGRAGPERMSLASSVAEGDEGGLLQDPGVLTFRPMSTQAPASSTTAAATTAGDASAGATAAAHAFEAATDRLTAIPATSSSAEDAAAASQRSALLKASAEGGSSRGLALLLVPDSGVITYKQSLAPRQGFHSTVPSQGSWLGGTEPDRAPYAGAGATAAPPQGPGAEGEMETRTALLAGIAGAAGAVLGAGGGAGSHARLQGVWAAKAALLRDCGWSVAALPLSEWRRTPGRKQRLQLLRDRLRDTAPAADPGPSP